ncbi:MAG: transposase [Verrucomicrobiae bacterium]|nr:transposase [Verrucomicrobiae bacterium]
MTALFRFRKRPEKSQSNEEPEHRKLRRFHQTWQPQPIYFITTCTHERRKILNVAAIHEILADEWRAARERHGWSVGRYVVMPDHVHFFCRPAIRATKSLSQFVAAWKQWTSKRITKSLRLSPPIWQKMFFDHVLRHSESYDEKWEYVFRNPVRHGYVNDPRDWPWAGKIDDMIW